MKNLFFGILALLTVGCGTDVKSTAFVDILRGPSDVNQLSACLSEEPTDDETVVITLDKQRLVDFSNDDQIDPNLASSFTDILANPDSVYG